MEFEKMLDEVYDLYNKDLVSQKFKTPDPIVERNTRRIHWKNIGKFIELMEPTGKDLSIREEHIINFIKVNTTMVNVCKYSETIKDGILIFFGKQKINDIKANGLIDDIIKKYSIQYVRCDKCNCYTTELIKDETIRKLKIKCNSCNSEYTIK